MKIIDSLKDRRSYYQIDKNIGVGEDEVLRLVEEATELVPDAFNMKSSRLVVVAGEKQEELWDGIYKVFDGSVAREKIDSFKAGYGTILYFYDEKVVEGLEDQFPSYKENFKTWANQASGMVQLAIWSGLREMGIGASLQHYNPIIDDLVREMFDLPDSYRLLAQMPFGGRLSEPEPKEKEDISKRVRLVK